MAGAMLLTALLLADTTNPSGTPSPGVVVSPPERLDGLNLQMPVPGEMALRVLAPTLLEITRINAKAPDPARVDSGISSTPTATSRCPPRPRSPSASAGSR